MHPQLTLDFELESSLSFETYWPGDTTLTRDVVAALAQGIGHDQQVYLWGPRHCGKTHLLSAACHSAVQKGLRIAYVPAQLLKTPESVTGFDGFDLVCIDDVQLLPHSQPAEMALFNVINDLHLGQRRLLLAANCVQSDLGVTLPDLHTRLCWGASYALTSVPADRVHEVLALRAEQMGLVLGSDVVNYLLTHYPRDLESLLDQLRLLDRASMQVKRKITIPLVREVLG